MNVSHLCRVIAPACLGTLLATTPFQALAQGGVTFRDIAAGGGAGLDYRRVPSASTAIFDALKRDPTFRLDRLHEVPMKARGAPGVAIFDVDLDGDLDLYVTNGPGAPNSLFANQLAESGEVRFVDVAVEAGVDATELDATGVCYGDTDNDGDPDLLVLSHNAPRRFYENRGDGTFDEISAASGLTASGARVSSGCSMGDIDGDGLLDIAIGNTFDNWDHFRGVTAEPWALNQHNQLFRNTGGNVFEDVSAASGIEELWFRDLDPESLFTRPERPAGLTWALALVDIDGDGDVDLVTADDQGGISTSQFGAERGLLHILLNDGRGHFTDLSEVSGTGVPGAWMGLAFADFNCDGLLDFFASNFGDYVPNAILQPGRNPSRWYLGEGGGLFADPGVGELVTTPFGWGNAAVDYDNDGDTDVIFHGGLDVGPGIEASNAGVVLENPDCTARFVLDTLALAGSTDHGRRTVHGMATGDLDGNGFVDLVSVSSFDLPPDVPLQPYQEIGSPFDATARFHPSFNVTDPATGALAWTGSTFADGTLSVELSNAENGNGWIEVRLLGTAGLLDGGRVNRDGVGAWVRVVPEGSGLAATKPVVAGSSYASQHALPLLFGLGDAAGAKVEVSWPGGGRTRLEATAGERLVIPEIPCPVDDPTTSMRVYLGCVMHALDELVEGGALPGEDRARLLLAALKERRDGVGEACAVDGELGDHLGVLASKMSFEPLGPEGGVRFRDIVTGGGAAGGAGLDFRRQRSVSSAKWDAIKLDPPYTPRKANDTPLKSRGVPGVALLDFDGDGDLDIYVTNGPGAANSLYSNQLRELGQTTFVDVAVAAGVDATDQDSTGVCFGDLDNDGDHELLVLSHNAPDRLFDNRGDGTFDDISAASGITDDGVWSSSGCSMGDVDGDGLLDITIANSYDTWDNNLALNVERFRLNQHNQLWINRGGNRFEAAGAASGLHDLAGFPEDVAGAAGLTWAVVMADFDLDGDIDILNGDDQSGFPTLAEGGVDRGLLHLFENDGTGRFTDVTLDRLGRKPGAWMGFAVGDFDCDGTLDFFGTNFGDFNPFVPQPPGRRASRWFLGQGGGAFSDPGVGDLVTTPFGWGASPFDYDNDGDLDLVFHGGHDVGIAVEASNGGVVLRNPGACSARFVLDEEALAESTDHDLRNVQGVAVGDLDQDGFLDIVSASNFDFPADTVFTPVPPLGSPFDPQAKVVMNFLPDPTTGDFLWTGQVFDDGALAVELSDGGNGNRSLSVRAVGGAGWVEGARVNRDAIGAVVRFRALGRPAPWTMRAIAGGSSYASQDALEAHFGLGRAERGVVEVLWPGGARNRLYNVRAGERVVLPEIPCSYDDATLELEGYVGCVLAAFDDLVAGGVIGAGERSRLMASALQARRSALGPPCP